LYFYPTNCLSFKSFDLCTSISTEFFVTLNIKRSETVNPPCLQSTLPNCLEFDILYISKNVWYLIINRFLSSDINNFSFYVTGNAFLSGISLNSLFSSASNILTFNLDLYPNTNNLHFALYML
jgi:hypothetical protein